MDAYLYNSETNQRFNIRFFESKIGLGGLSATYSSNDTVGGFNSGGSWVRTEAIATNLNIVLNGRSVNAAIAELRAFLTPIKGKSSIPVCVLVIGDTPPLVIRIVSIAPQYDFGAPIETGDFDSNPILNKTGKSKRVTVQIGFIEAGGDQAKNNQIINAAWQR